MATITNGSESVTPILVLGYESTRRSGNVVHRVLDNSIRVSLQQPAPRKGTLEMLFADEPAAAAAEQFHLRPGVFRLAAADAPTVDMGYVLQQDGEVKRTLDKDTRVLWLLMVDFQEVLL